MTKKYKITAQIASIAIIGSMFLPLAVNAEQASTSVNATVTGTSTIKDLRDMRKEKLDELRNKADEKKAEIKGKIEEIKQNRASTTEAIKEKRDEKRDERRDKIAERVTDFVSKVKERLTATTDRFDKIVLRIESRITKLDGQGATTTEAKALLIDAKAKITIAKTDIASINATTTATSTTELKGVYQGLKTQFDKAKVDLKSAQDALVKTINSLGKLNAEAHATTSASINNN